MPSSRYRDITYLKTGEVAELLGVTKQTVLNWLRKGVIIEPTRNDATGYRLWTEKDVAGIRRALREKKNGPASNF